MTVMRRNNVELLKIISIPYIFTQKEARGKAEETLYAVSSFAALLRRTNPYAVNVAAQHCVQLTPLARPLGWA